MSKKFNLDDYKGKYVMYCKTEEEAKDFCRVLHEAGRKWDDGISYEVTTRFEVFTVCTCYNFNAGSVGNYLFYDSHGYTILEWSDFMRKEFTKDDLKTGDVVLRRGGTVNIYVETATENRFVSLLGYFRSFDYIRQDLTGVTNSELDIIAVRRPNDISDMSFDAFEKKLGSLVYERDETVEMTLEEVCKALGKNVKIVKE